MKKLVSLFVLLALLLSVITAAEVSVNSYSPARQAERLMRCNEFEPPDERAQAEYSGRWYAHQVIYMDVLPANAADCWGDCVLTIMPDGSALLESDWELGLVEEVMSIPMIWGCSLGGVWMRPTDEFLTEYASKEPVLNEDEPYLMQTMNEVDVFRLTLEDGKLALHSSAQIFTAVFAREKTERSSYPFQNPLFAKDVSEFDGCWYPYKIELYSFPIDMKDLPRVSALEIKIEHGLISCEALHLANVEFDLKESRTNMGTLLVYDASEPISYFSFFADAIEPEEYSLDICDGSLSFCCSRYLIFYCERAG